MDKWMKWQWTLIAIGLALVMLVIFINQDFGGEYESDISAASITRELRCQEDEDIVVSLGDNGLPYGFCQQVIER